MSYPTLEQYNLALQSPHLTLIDPVLRQGSLKMSGLGIPLALCGGFALTYTVNAGGKRYALRCFHKESHELEKRYQAISSRLKQISSPYFLPFEFISKGIRIGGKEYPIVKMEWASGETLSEFLERQHRNPTSLNRLRSTLRNLNEFLEREEIAHGDIQPDNIMVSQDGANLQLIDYDGMFVSALRGSNAKEIGQLNFQHPQRSERDFNEKLDRFSFIILDVALQALIADSRIWTNSQSDPNAVVFRRADYQSPGSSRVFQEILGNSSIQIHARNLALVAAGSMAQIPTLREFLNQKGIPQISVSFSSTSKVSRPSYQGPYDVFSGTDYTGVLRRIGDKIEIVGQIVSAEKKYSPKTRSHYIFVNFYDWRKNGVKLNIWADGLKALGNDAPDKSWVGKWITVSGMIEELYPPLSEESPYRHVSITITQKGQIQALNPEEAKYRLGGNAPVKAGPSNSDVLMGIGGKANSANSSASPNVHIPTPKTGNQGVLDQMKRSTSTPPLQPQPLNAPAAQPPPPQHQSQKKRKKNVWGFIIAVAIAYLLIKACSI